MAVAYETDSLISLSVLSGRTRVVVINSRWSVAATTGNLVHVYIHAEGNASVNTTHSFSSTEIRVDRHWAVKICVFEYGGAGSGKILYCAYYYSHLTC